MKYFLKKIFCCFSKPQKIDHILGYDISPKKFNYFLQINNKPFYYKNYSIIHNLSFSNSTSTLNNINSI